MLGSWQRQQHRWMGIYFIYDVYFFRQVVLLPVKMDLPSMKMIFVDGLLPTVGPFPHLEKLFSAT